jgi:hypothetical protein
MDISTYEEKTSRKKLRNEGLHNFFLSHVIRMIRSREVRTSSTYGREGKCINPEGSTPLGVPRHRQEDNIKIDRKETELRVWIGFIWLRIGTCGGLVSTLAMKVLVP